jgi:hypothetical protein
MTKTRKTILALASSLPWLVACATLTSPPTSPFDVPDPQGTTPVVFFPNEVSRTETPQWDVAISPDGSALFYSTDAPRRIVKQTWTGKGWSAPQAAATLLPKMSYGGVSSSPDGDYLYFSAAPDGEKRDIYRQSLTEPESFPERITDTPLYGEISLSIDVAGNGFMWTDSKRDGSAGIGFYRIRLQDGDLEIIEDASNLHPGDRSGDNSPYVDPAGRFLLFANYDVTPETDEDLFLSELRDGIPLPPVALGDIVNTPAAETSPTITPDGRYLIFASNRPTVDGREGDYQLFAIPTGSVAVEGWSVSQNKRLA